MRNHIRKQTSENAIIVHKHLTSFFTAKHPQASDLIPLHFCPRGEVFKQGQECVPLRKCEADRGVH